VPVIRRVRRIVGRARPSRVRARVLRRLPAPPVVWPAAVDLRLSDVELAGRTVLDVGPPDGAVAAQAAAAGAAGTTAAARVEDVVVLRDLDRASDPGGTVFALYERTGEVAVIATPATEWPGQPAVGLIEILDAEPDAAGAGVAWPAGAGQPGAAGPGAPARWSPSADGLRELCLAAGFTDVRLVAGPPSFRPRGWRPVRYRAVVHARP
jgi:hypothetical protein